MFFEPSAAQSVSHDLSFRSTGDGRSIRRYDGAIKQKSDYSLLMR
jgi:hypothetical protein